MKLVKVCRTKVDEVVANFKKFVAIFGRFVFKL